MGSIAVWLAVLSTVVMWPSRADAVVLINEVLADPPAVGGDANGDGVVSATQDEFVELVNVGTTAVSLTGWSLSDALKMRHLFAADASIPGYGFFVVFGGGLPQGFDHVAVASSGGLSLNNAGDTVVLRAADGTLVETFVYGREGGDDVSLTRFPDAEGPFVQHSAVSGEPFSPGETVEGRRTLLRSPDPPGAPEPASLLLFGVGLGGFLLGLRRHVRTGQPWGTTDWLAQLEHQLGRPLRPRTGGWPKGRPRSARSVSRGVLPSLSPEFLGNLRGA